MTIASENLTPVLAEQTKVLKKDAPNTAGGYFWMDDNHTVDVVM